MGYQIISISSLKSFRLFHQVPREVYRDQPQWIEPLWNDIESSLKDSSLPFEAWVVVEANSPRPVGRIAAFKHHDSNQGGIGFFESIQNTEVAQMLFSKAELWLLKNGVQEVKGPIHPSSKDQFWGLLIDGFEKTPSYRKSYHMPYYRTYFEEQGYALDYYQYTFSRSLEEGTPATLQKKMARILSNPRFTFKPLGKNSLDDFAKDFREIYNVAWKSIPDFKPLSEEQVTGFMKKMKPILDRGLLWRAYDGKKVAGFVIFTPEINPFLQSAHGHLGWFEKIKFFLNLKLRGISRATGIAFGVLPEYRGLGLAHALVSYAGENIRQKKSYREFELNWIGSFNPRMIALVESFGAEKSKTFATFKKELLAC